VGNHSIARNTGTSVSFGKGNLTESFFKTYFCFHQNKTIMSKSDQAQSNAGWDMVIRPKSTWLDIDLKGIWNYRDLIALFVRRDFVASYKQTILGPLWMLLQPLVNTLMYVFVFVVIARMNTGAVPPILQIMSGLIPWLYFADCINRNAVTFTGNAAIFGKVYFPRLVMPVSVVISNAVKFGLQLIMLALIYVFYICIGVAVHPTKHLLFFPVLVLMLAGYGLRWNSVFDVCIRCCFSRKYIW
jgi:lipopolysaccharide transport system permease protein